MSSSPRDPAERAVAVVGLGAILPDALNVETFWGNVLAGKDSITEVTPDRWDPADYYDPDPKAPEKTYSKIGGWVRGFRFDPMRYRIPPKVAAEMDEGQQWAIAATSELLKDAGHPDKPLDLENTAVILGNAMGGERHYVTATRLFAPIFHHALEATAVFRSLSPEARTAVLAEFQREIQSRLPETTEDTMPGELANITAGRVAAVFNMRGPNFTTDAACASSLAALEASINGLIDHHYDAVVTGGFDRNMGVSAFIKFCKIGALSADGSRPYAKGSNGFVMGEGGAVFLLKRIEDAEKAGDRIYAIVRAVGASSDGKGKGITAPNPAGQIIAVRRAWERAGLSPGSVTLLEGHGTSTAVGDVAEVTTLSDAMASERLRPRSVALGSIKSQIGHLKAGAGAAGLLKAVLAIHNKVIPPSINFREPNPNVDWSKTPFWVPTKAEPWERPANNPRRAAVSAFGFGGTNFHVVLEEYVPGLLTSRKTSSSVPPSFNGGGNGVGAKAQPSPAPHGNLLALGGRDSRALQDQLRAALDQAKAGTLPPRKVPDDAVLAAPERLVLGFDTAADLIKLGEASLAALEKGDDPRAWRVLQTKGANRRSGVPGKVAFLFPGQGSQYVNMLSELRKLDPIVAETFEEADSVMKPLLGRPLTDYLFVDSTDPEVLAKADAELRATVVCQPAVLSVDVALMRLLGRYGIAPDLVMGHSLGEWAAIVAAGLVPFSNALVAVSSRARGMASVAPPDPGKMASVLGPFEEIQRRLDAMPGYVVAANINSRNQTVIAGDSASVVAAVDQFKEAGFTVQLLPVSHAFHSRIVAAASVPLRKVLDTIPMQLPAVPIISNVNGQVYPGDLEAIREQLSQQLASPVQWVKCLDTAYREGARIFVEVGPKRVLRGFAEDVLGDRPGVLCLSTNHPKRGELASFHDALCGLYAAGLPRPVAQTSAYVPSVASAPQPPVAAPPARAMGAPPAPPAPTFSRPAPVPASPQGGPDYQALGHLFARFLEEGMSLYRGQAPASAAPVGYAAGQPVVVSPATEPAAFGSVVISGGGLGLPGTARHVFNDSNIDDILAGQSFIEPISEEGRRRIVDKNIVRLVKREIGEPSMDPIRTTDDVIKLSARKGAFDLVREFGIEANRVDAFDVTTSLAIAAGIEALRDAGIPLVRHYRRTTTGSHLPDRWLLPRAFADETGVIFGSAFPGYNRFAEDLERYHQDKLKRAIIAELSQIARDNPAARTRIAELEAEISREGYAFDRRFMFRILSMGHSQFAELFGARGPNTAVNAACASATQGIAIASDWIRTGRCRRVIVISADDISSSNLHEWFGAGFLATGAATTEARVDLAALPFDKRRNGMLVGMGAGAVVVESEDAVAERGMRGIAEVLVSETANSAYHGTRLDVEHISDVMDRNIAAFEASYGVPRANVAREMLFMSHETYTPARGGSASAEVHGLRRVFGPHASEIVIANTKGFTGHPMGVAIEDVVAIKALERQIVPPVPNYKEPDPELGQLNLSRGGHYPVRYALRFAAGFGSQMALTLVRRVPGCEQRVRDAGAYQHWLTAVSGYDQATTEVDHRTLRIRDLGVPQREPASTTWVRGRTPIARVLPTPAEEMGGAAVPATAPGPAAPLGAPPAPSAPQPVAAAPAAPVLGDPIGEKVLSLVSEKTGYPRDMLAPDLDLEADLGIDTVKQAEVFAQVRETFNIPRQENLKLREYPTLKHVIGFVKTHRPDLVAAAPVAPAAPAPAPAVVASVPTVDPTAEKVLAVVSEKTGYPRDMLDLDLDLEADLGIDTVKQAEVFATVRDTFNIPRQENLKLREYPTLKHVIGFVRQHRPDLAVAAPVPAAPMNYAAPVATAAVGASDPTAEKVLAVVSEKTGYPRDMLDLDLDLEADLGIDTVKQAEVFATVRETFNIPRQENLKLREYPTLKHVIGFVRQHRPDLAVAVPAAPATVAAAPAPVASPPATVAAAPSATPAAASGHDEITLKVLAVVSDKTGYPADMLELDLDLEADLGIDTVKQAEVFATVRETFNIPRQENLKLREYPTLKHVVGFVRKSLGGSAAEPSTETSAAAAQATTSAAASSPPGDLLRIPVPVLRPSLELCKPTSARLAAQRRVLIVPDRGGVAGALTELLQTRGVEVTTLDDSSSPDEALQKTAEWAKAGDASGVYFLAGVDASNNLPDITPEAFREIDQRQIKRLCGVTRAFYDALDQRGAFLVTATRLGGVHGYEPAGATSAVGGAITGFTKAIQRERTAAVVKTVDFEAAAGASDVARALLAETERDPDVVEVGYRSGDRFTIGAIEQDRALTRPGTPMTLDASRAFVVTGGAGAITSAIVLDLARASKASFHLLDLLPAPDEATKNEVARMATDREGLKRDIFDRIKAETGRATPAQVEKRLFELERAGAILDTLRGVESAGGKAYYHSADVTSFEAVSKAIESVVATSGRIDVLIHTAGLERSRTFDTKPQDEFDRVYGVKVFGLHNLLRATRELEVGALVCFSSVAGRFGNAGQADYSAANDLMCKASAAFRASRPGAIAVTFDWSAWGGIGMATRGSVPEMMRRAGIEMLDPNEATPLVRQALTVGLSSEAVVGRRLGVLLEPVDADGGLDEQAALRIAEGRKQGLPVQSVKLNKHTGLEVRITLDPKKEAFLFDHQIDGTPVLPGVMGLETFAETATLLAPGYGVAAIEHVRFLAPMKYYRNEPRTAVVRALPMRDADGRVRVKCTLSSSQAIAGGMTKDTVHFVAEVVLEKPGSGADRTPTEPIVRGDADPASIGRDAVYRVYFHGPAYQVLSKVDLCGDRAVAGAMAEGLPADRSNVEGVWIFTPRLVELCFQTAGVYEIGLTGLMGLPSVLDRVVVHETPAALTSLVAEVRAVGAPGNGVPSSLAFDARVTGPDGRVYVELSGYRTSTMPGSLPEAELAPFRAVAPTASPEA